MTRRVTQDFKNRYAVSKGPFSRVESGESCEKSASSASVKENSPIYEGRVLREAALTSNLEDGCLQPRPFQQLMVEGTPWKRSQQVQRAVISLEVEADFTLTFGEAQNVLLVLGHYFEGARNRPLSLCCSCLKIEAIVDNAQQACFYKINCGLAEHTFRAGTSLWFAFLAHHLGRALL